MPQLVGAQSAESSQEKLFRVPSREPLGLPVGTPFRPQFLLRPICFSTHHSTRKGHEGHAH